MSGSCHEKGPPHLCETYGRGLHFWCLVSPIAKRVTQNRVCNASAITFCKAVINVGEDASYTEDGLLEICFFSLSLIHPLFPAKVCYELKILEFSFVE